MSLSQRSGCFQRSCRVKTAQTLEQVLGWRWSSRERCSVCSLLVWATVALSCSQATYWRKQRLNHLLHFAFSLACFHNSERPVHGHGSFRTCLNKCQRSLMIHSWSLWFLSLAYACQLSTTWCPPYQRRRNHQSSALACCDQLSSPDTTETSKALAWNRPYLPYQYL